MKFPFALLLIPFIVLSSCSTNTGQFVAEGTQLRIPNLTERDQNNHLISLRDYSRKDYLLVFFYPEADTPG